MSKVKVFITGYGILSSYGWGKKALNEGLLSGDRVMKPFLSKYTESCLARMGCFIPQKQCNKYNAYELLDTAFQEAYTQAASPNLEKSMLIMGTGLGDINLYEKELYESNSLSKDFWKCSIGYLGYLLAKKRGINGYSSISTGCSSSNYAIIRAYNLIQLGEYECIICCGVELGSITVLNCFNRMGGADPLGAVPFSVNRQGTMMGEGIGVLIIESEQHCLKRGVQPLAEISGVGMSCDAFDVVAPEMTGKEIVKAMKQAISSSCLNYKDIDLILAHGTGTILNDSCEAKAINEIFVDTKPIVLALKGLLGHTGGASNIMAICSLLGFYKKNKICGNYMTVEQPLDRSLQLNLPFDNQPLFKGNTLINGFAFGGNNASIVITRYEKKT